MVIGGVGPSPRNDDVPYPVPGLSTNESLGTEASVQEIDTPEPICALNFIRTDAPLKCLKDLYPPRLAHGVILTALDCLANVEVDCEQDVPDGDDGILRRM